MADRVTVDSLGSEVTAVAAVLDTAERRRRIHDVALVDTEGPGPHPSRYAVPAVDVGGEYRPGQPVLGVVGDPDGLVLVAGGR